MSYELLIQNDNTVYAPVVQDDITWETERKGVPGKLTFKVTKDNILNFKEGNAIRLTKDNVNVFYGFVFTIK